jgi:hypothetical protein
MRCNSMVLVTPVRSTLLGGAENHMSITPFEPQRISPGESMTCTLPPIADLHFIPSRRPGTGH